MPKSDLPDRPSLEYLRKLAKDTDRIDDLYSELKRRQLLRSRRLLEGEPDESPEISFTSDLYTAFYGQREFGIRDPNGVELMFAQATNEVR